MAKTTSWFHRNIKGVLLDITGVLYNSGEGGGAPIEGSIEAVKRLQASDLQVRFCSNESQTTTSNLVSKLERHGFELSESQVFTPAPAVAKVLNQRNLRPFLLIHANALPNFTGIPQNDPNCVVVGDAEKYFTYENVNNAFRILISSENPILISMGSGKFYKDTDGLMLDLGAYTKALEYSCGIKAEIIGKPSEAYFKLALDDMGVSADEAVMIGDDIVSDVGGAQVAGIRGIQVRTGKWMSAWENHPTVKPDGIVDNLAEAVELILKHHG